MKTFTAYTNEIDDVQTAVSEVMEQLDLNQLEKNSIGLLSCYADFIESGVVKALCEQLPFDVVGASTMQNAVPGAVGEMMLSLMVITGDEVSFAPGISMPISSEDDAPLRQGYDAAKAGRNEEPVFIISFAPLLLNLSGDFFAESMDRISGFVPNFGTLAVDHTNDYSKAQVIYCGEAYRDKYAFVLVYGDISPIFLVGAISDEKVFREKGAVTASKGNQLQAVNGISVADYLLSLGLSKDESGNILGINTFPFIVDFNDGTPPVVRAVFAMTEDGCVVCAGKVPVGATLSLGTMDAKEVLSTTAAVLEKALSKNKRNGMILFSCVGRYFAQGYDPTAEAVMVEKRLHGELPFHYACSGTELCPVKSEQGGLKNRSHNDSIVMCIF